MEKEKTGVQAWICNKQILKRVSVRSQMKNDDGGPEGTERGWENACREEKQRADCVMRLMGFLPVGRRGHRLTAATGKKKTPKNRKICDTYHLTAVPPKHTHTHTRTYSIPTCTSLQNSGLTHRSDVRAGGVTQIPQILLFMHSSQLHPSPTQPPTHSLQHQVPPIYVSYWTLAFVTHARRLTNSALKKWHYSKNRFICCCVKLYTENRVNCKYAWLDLDMWILISYKNDTGFTRVNSYWHKYM